MKLLHKLAIAAASTFTLISLSALPVALALEVDIEPELDGPFVCSYVDHGVQVKVTYHDEAIECPDYEPLHVRHGKDDLNCTLVIHGRFVN